MANPQTDTALATGFTPTTDGHSLVLDGHTPIADGTSHPAGPDIYEKANTILVSLIHDLCDTMEIQQPEKFKRIGYEMIGRYSQKPMNTGELTLIFATVLQDILAKLEMAEQNENITLVRDPYTIMRLEE